MCATGLLAEESLTGPGSSQTLPVARFLSGIALLILIAQRAAFVSLLRMLLVSLAHQLYFQFSNLA